MRKTIMTIFAMTLLVSACGPAKQPELTISNDTTWELEYITGLRMSLQGLYPQKLPQIQFDTTKNQVSGNNSCNNFSIPYQMNNGKLQFSENGISTQMACPGPGEPHFMNMLQQTDSFTLAQNKLLLYKEGVPTMRFKKQSL